MACNVSDIIDHYNWVEEDRLERVKAYLIQWTPEYWPVICQGGIRGYSMFLHEWVELREYGLLGKNPMILSEQVAGYPYTHPRALLAEHRFLQMVASTMHFSFSLRELVLWNPHGDEPIDESNDDWVMLEAQLGQHYLSQDDCLCNASRKADVVAFFERLGFERVV